MEAACNHSNRTTNHITVGINHVFSGGTDGLMLGLYITVVSISAPGNLLLLFVVCRNKSMRTFTNFLICNAAVSDLLTTIVPGMLSLFDAMTSHDHIWMFGGCMCKLVYMSSYWSVSVTIISLMVIAIDRYYLIMYPHRKYLTNNMLRAIIPAIWIIGFIFASPSTFVMELKHINGEDFCVETWLPPFDPINSPKYYIIILFLFLYALPLTLMSGIYTVIGFKLSGFNIVEEMRRVTRVYLLRHSSHEEDLITNVISECNKDGVGIDESAIQYGGRVEEATMKVHFAPTLPFQAKLRGNSVCARKQRIIKMLIAIIICFVVCWSPVYIIQFITFFHPDYAGCPGTMPGWAHIIALSMQYCNGALNPLLYFGFSDTYRKGLKKGLKRLCGQHRAGGKKFLHTKV